MVILKNTAFGCHYGAIDACSGQAELGNTGCTDREALATLLRPLAAQGPTLKVPLAAQAAMRRSLSAVLGSTVYASKARPVQG